MTFTRATFQTTATLWAPYLDADDDFEIDDDDLVPPTVQPGNHFSMVPSVRANLGATLDARGWRTGERLSHTGSQWLRGDEDNQEPNDRLESYTLLHAHLERGIRRATVYLKVENLLDTDHATFGVLALNRLSDPQHPHVESFVTPGQPRRVYAGMRLRLW